MPKSERTSATPSAPKRRATPASAIQEVSSSTSADWLAMALEHHAQIRRAFARASEAPGGGARLAAMKALALLLNGHSLAEETVLYPALARAEAGKAAKQLYDEQSDAKVEMAALEHLDPSAEAWAAQLAAIRDAVEAHMVEEETTWFPRLAAAGLDTAKLTARYQEEFDRYTHIGHIGSNAAWAGPPRAL